MRKRNLVIDPAKPYQNQNDEKSYNPMTFYNFMLFHRAIELGKKN